MKRNKYTIMSVDPGTINTGVVVAELGPDNSLIPVNTYKILKKKGDAWRRVSDIITVLANIIEEHEVDELWVELYIPYGARKGSLWNMMLVGALLYLPVTRSVEKLTSYGLYAREWKQWLKKETPGCDNDSKRARTFALNHGIEFTDEMEEMLTDIHIADALGILLFTRYAGGHNEHPSCNSPE